MTNNFVFYTFRRCNKMTSYPMDNNSILGFTEANCEKCCKVFRQCNQTSCRYLTTRIGCITDHMCRIHGIDSEAMSDTADDGDYGSITIPTAAHNNQHHVKIYRLNLTTNIILRSICSTDRENLTALNNLRRLLNASISNPEHVASIALSEINPC